MLVVVHSHSKTNMRPQWGFLTIFYKCMKQQYFIVTAPNTVFSRYKTNKISNAGSCTQGNMRPPFLSKGFLYKYMIQQYFIVTAPNPVVLQFKANKLSNAGTCTLVHMEVHLWHPRAPLRPHLRSSEFHKAPRLTHFLQ